MILVTGATGKVGKELVDRLIDRRAPVRVLVRDEKKVSYLGDRVQKAVGDLEDPETIAAAMKDVERVFFVTHLTHQVTSLLEAVKQAGVKHVVKLSSLEVNASQGPGRWHREQEELVRASCEGWTFLRPNMFMDNLIQWWSGSIKAHTSVFFPGGEGRSAPIDVRDIADVACEALTSSQHVGKVYELTGPETLSVSDLVGILGRVLGKQIRYVNIPASETKSWIDRLGLPSDLAKALGETFESLRRSEHGYVTDTVKQVCNHEPRSFEAWCKGHIDAFK